LVLQTFWGFINGNNDGQQIFNLSLVHLMGRPTPRNNILDDYYSWDAIWENKAIITEFGWAVEMRIPMQLCAFQTKKNKLGA
jgi:hypothetical protein